MISSLRGLVRRRTVRATLTNSAVNACVLCLNLGTGLLTARFLGPEGRGACTAMVIWPQFLASLFTLGLQQAVPYNLVRRPEDRAAITAVALLLSLGAGSAAALIGSALVPFWLDQYGPEILAMARVILWLAPVVLLVWTCNACMQAAGHFDLFNRSQYLQPVLSLLGLLVLAALDLLTSVSPPGSASSPLSRSPCLSPCSGPGSSRPSTAPTSRRPRCPFRSWWPRPPWRRSARPWRRPS